MLYFHCGDTNCDKWSMAPEGFDEAKHFVECTCGLAMYLQTIGTPKDIGLGKASEVVGKLIPQPKV